MVGWFFCGLNQQLRGERERERERGRCRGIVDRRDTLLHRLEIYIIVAVVDEKISILVEDSYTERGNSAVLR
jgi:hypothetical protein